jgi:crotonobetainyl-CoA:carnitine CoA-transferase CaiB-like acyl-CoA transferase
MERLLHGADLFVTAQRPAALARLGLDSASLAARHPRLCHVAITGHAAPDEDVPGHDLTYLASHGLITPPTLPPTLFADMAGSERVVSTALALVHARDRDGRAHSAAVALADAAAALAQPRDEGLTRAGALLGGGFAGYNLYAAQQGWVAVAALEPHFGRKLAAALGLEQLTADGLAQRFAKHTASHWESWARALDLPIVAVRTSTSAEK